MSDPGEGRIAHLPPATPWRAIGALACLVVLLAACSSSGSGTATRLITR